MATGNLRLEIPAGVVLQNAEVLSLIRGMAKVVNIFEVISRVVHCRKKDK